MVIQENWHVQELESARHGYKDWKTFAIRSEKTNVCLAIVGEIDRYHEKEYKSIAHVMATAPELLEVCKWLLKAYKGMLKEAGIHFKKGQIPGITQAEQAIKKAR